MMTARRIHFFFYFFSFSLLHSRFAVLHAFIACREQIVEKNGKEKFIAHVLLVIAGVSALLRRRREKAILACMLVSSIIHA
jgi:hypothetical protein